MVDRKHISNKLVWFFIALSLLTATLVGMAFYVRWQNVLVGDWTYEGMLPATSTDLTSDISAGISFVQRQRVAISAISRTYTASKDTYVYVNSSGALIYQEVANGATQPSDPANSLLLAKVVTDNDNITSVSDQRRLIPILLIP